jgi:hypothetical protein
MAAVGAGVRLDVLLQAHRKILLHGLIGVALQIPLHALAEVGGEACFGGGLKQRKIIQFVVLV